MSALYHLRFFIEIGVTCCLWSQNAAAKERFGYSVDFDDLDLPADVLEDTLRLLADFEHLFAMHDPGGEVEEVDTGPTVFGFEAEAPFRDRVAALVKRLRQALGPEFLVETDFEG